MEPRSRLRYAGAALLGSLGVGIPVAEIVVSATSPNPADAFGIPILLVVGIVLIVGARALLTDSPWAWLFAALVAGALVALGVSLTPAYPNLPQTYVLDAAAGGMVLVIAARAIETLIRRQDRRRGDR